LKGKKVSLASLKSLGIDTIAAVWVASEVVATAALEAPVLES